MKNKRIFYPLESKDYDYPIAILIGVILLAYAQISSVFNNLVKSISKIIFIDETILVVIVYFALIFSGLYFLKLLQFVFYLIFIKISEIFKKM